MNPNVKRGPFTADEDDTILAQHAIHGNKWAVISRSMPGRTDNQVKNRFNSTLRRLIASQKKEGSGASAPISPRARSTSRPQGRLASERETASIASSPTRVKRERSTSPSENASGTGADEGQGSPNKRSRAKVVDKTARSRQSESPRMAGSNPSDRQGLENLIEASLMELERLKSIKGAIYEWGVMPYGPARDSNTPEPSRSDEDGVVPSLHAPKPKRGGFSVPVPLNLYEWRLHAPVSGGIKRVDSLASLGEMISRPSSALSAPLSVQSALQSNGWYARMLDNLGTHKGSMCEDISSAEIHSESFVKPKAMFMTSPRPTRVFV